MRFETVLSCSNSHVSIQHSNKTGCEIFYKLLPQRSWATTTTFARSRLRTLPERILLIATKQKVLVNVGQCHIN